MNIRIFLAASLAVVCLSSRSETITLYEAHPSDMGLLSQPVDAEATDETRALYDFLYYNFGRKVMTCSMARPAWDYDIAQELYTAHGQWPVMHCFDLMHLCYSPCDWIDYSDITPVKQWHQQGGAVALMWHWQVPTTNPSSASAPSAPITCTVASGFPASAPSAPITCTVASGFPAGTISYTSTASETAFTPANVETVGSWEHQQFYADLYEAYTVIKALQDEGIAVIWRPFHEAAGNVPNGGSAWFWWGKSGAATFKSLWKRMYDYFLERDIHNLLWVWTSCDDDGDWYPGDDYVDIVGTDIYNKDLNAVKNRFTALRQRYPSRITALSECGSVPYIVLQQQQGAWWSWTMPWYGNNDNNTPWATTQWWKNAIDCYDRGCDVSISASSSSQVAVGDLIYVSVTALGIGGEPKAVFQTPQYEDIPGSIQWPVLTGDFQLAVTADNVDIIRQGMLVRGLNFVIRTVELRQGGASSIATLPSDQPYPVATYTLDGRRADDSASTFPVRIHRMSDGTMCKTLSKSR